MPNFHASTNVIAPSRALNWKRSTTESIDLSGQDLGSLMAQLVERWTEKAIITLKKISYFNIPEAGALYSDSECTYTVTGKCCCSCCCWRWWRWWWWWWWWVWDGVYTEIQDDRGSVDALSPANLIGLYQGTVKDTESKIDPFLGWQPVKR